MERLSYRNILGEAYLERGADAIWSKCEAYDILKNAINKLAAYEDTGLTSQEIEHMKTRMPLRYWAGENPDKMSIFGVSVSRIMELTKAEKEGRLLKLPYKKGYIKHDGHMDEVELYSIDFSGYEIVYTYYGICELDNLPFEIDIKENEIENKLLLEI